MSELYEKAAEALSARHPTHDFGYVDGAWVKVGRGYQCQPEVISRSAMRSQIRGHGVRLHGTFDDHCTALIGLPLQGTER